jgi:plastocyanin
MLEPGAASRVGRVPVLEAVSVLKANMRKRSTYIGFQLGGILIPSLLLSLFIACATPQYGSVAAPSQSTPTALLSTNTSVAVMPSEPSPTHLPRQHSGAHIEGLGDPVDAPHFVDSFPNHAQTLTQSPARVGINFDTPLTRDSSITVEREGTSVELGELVFDPRNIYMSAPLPRELGDGLYLVKYRACFADSNCSDGQIGFRVDAASVKNFVDLTNQKQVTIQLQDVKYQPNQIIVSPGTTVTWMNDDPFEHFVNSDPHPSHNAFPDLNSLDIPPSKTFSYTFEQVGEYAFHCSAHVPQNMFGTILVRENESVAATPSTAPTTSAQLEPTVTPTATAFPTAPVPSTVAPTQVPATRVSPTRAPTIVPTSVPPTTAPTVPSKAKVPEASLPPQRFAAHFVSSSPEHADLVAAVPQKIQIDFNFVLARNSNINVLKDSEKLALGDLEFSENRLHMSVNLPDAGAGTYHVLYRACWPDKSCHDGEFAFVVQ